MKDIGALYYQRGIDFFENGEYEKAVEDWIQAYETGYEKKLILENLYGCFIEPNDEEYRKNYILNSEGFTRLDYQECLLDFIPVSEKRFYIFDKEAGIFRGTIDLEKMPVQGKKEIFDSILFIDVWDIREIMPELQENSRNLVYLLLNDMEQLFVSFFKLPRFRELYCSNMIVFRDVRIMQAFFEEYEEFYLPKQFVADDKKVDRYTGLFQEIHKKRVCNRQEERTNVFLSICIPRKTDKETILQLRSCICQCFYDSEIEVLIAGDRDEKDAEDVRIHYFAYDEQECFIVNVLKVIDMAKGRYQIITDATDFQIWQKLGENLDYIKAHSDQKVFSMHDGVLGGILDFYTDLERLQYLVPKIIREKKDIFLCMELKNQYIAASFFNGERVDIIQNWEQAGYLIKTMQQLLKMDKVRIPVEKRDNNLVVMATTQLLTPSHAPTRILLEMSRILEIYLNKKVFLLSEIKEYDEDACSKAGLKKAVTFHFEKELNGKFEYCYKECCFSGYQIQLKRENIQEMQNLIQELCDRRPYCVWCFGGVPAFAGAMKQFTTMIYTQFMEGYPGVPADLVVNYFEHASVNYPQEKEFLIAQGVKVQEIQIGLPSYKKSKGIYHRRDFGIPEDAFCIGIAGNRLENDCTDEFLDMFGLVHSHTSKKVCLVFIGGTNDGFVRKVVERIKETFSIRFLGYRSEFADAIALVDLVVATPGLGNGGTGVTALQEGIPVVSLEVGDIASCVGKDFQCSSLEEYPALIQKYIDDPEFYEAQSKKAVNVFQSLLVEEEVVAQQVQEVLEQVKGL